MKLDPPTVLFISTVDAADNVDIFVLLFVDSFEVFAV